MADTKSTQTEWYLARDGQQFGPISNIEMRKLIELGHLRSTDLVWRAGLSEWHPGAFAVQELASAPAPAPEEPAGGPTTAQPQQPQAQHPQAQQPASGGSPSLAQAQPSAHHQPHSKAHEARPGADVAARHVQPAGPTAQRPAGHHPQRHAQSHAAQAGHPQAEGEAQGRQQPQQMQRPGQHPDAPAQDRAHDPGRAGYRNAVADHKADRRDIDDDDYDDEEPKSGAAGLALRAIAAVLILALIGGGGWFAYQNKDTLMQMVAGAPGDGKEVPRIRSTETTVTTLAPSSAAPDKEKSAPKIALLETPLWTSLSDAFPAWAEKQRHDAFEMQRSGTSVQDVEFVLVRRIASLRREYAKRALSAPPESLRAIATAFLNNLKLLSAKNTDACYGFIRRGEADPRVQQLMANDVKFAEPIRGQLRIVITAIVSGGKDPATHSPPLQKDYRMISAELTKLGWTNTEMSLFGDPKKLSQADPATVCRLVTDWFTAQLALTDQEAQTRLLVQSLRPVVAG